MTEKMGEFRSLIFQRETMIKESDSKIKILEEEIYSIKPRIIQKEMELRKNESQIVDQLTVTFNRFLMGDHMDQAPMGGRAELSITFSEGSYSKDYSIQPTFWMENGKIHGNTIEIPESPYKIHIESIDANEGKILLIGR